MKLRHLFGLFFGILICMTYVVYFSQGQDPLHALKGAEANDDNFVYKVDPRRFDQNPNNVAIKEKWTKDRDVMVRIEPKDKRMRPFHIDAYEALISNKRAWSVPGHEPTDKLRPGDAQKACKAAGKRLCTVHEWQTACRGGHVKKVTFKNAEQLVQQCDFARSAGYDRNDWVNKSDSHPQCIPHGYPLHHMLGNVSEFVEASDGRVMIVGLTYFDARIQNKVAAMRSGCDRVVAGPGQYPAQRYNKALGFRCCRDAQ